MIRRIVHHQNYLPSWGALHQQFFSKSDEGRTVLGFGGGPGDRIFALVVSAERVPMLLLLGRVAGIRFC
jgi:hypothetical protein